MVSHNATVRRLTGNNIDALRTMLTDTERQHVTLGATVATFHLPIADAITLVERLHQRAGQTHGTTGHPSRSLPAVLRKLRALGGDQA